MSKNGTVKATRTLKRRPTRAKDTSAAAISANIPMPLDLVPMGNKVIISSASGEAKRFTDITEAQRYLRTDLKCQAAFPRQQIEITARLSNGASFDASFQRTEEALAFLDHVAG